MNEPMKLFSHRICLYINKIKIQSSLLNEENLKEKIELSVYFFDEAFSHKFSSKIFVDEIGGSRVIMTDLFALFYFFTETKVESIKDCKEIPLKFHLKQGKMAIGEFEMTFSELESKQRIEFIEFTKYFINHSTGTIDSEMQIFSGLNINLSQNTEFIPTKRKGKIYIPVLDYIGWQPLTLDWYKFLQERKREINREKRKMRNNHQSLTISFCF